VKEVGDRGGERGECEGEVMVREVKGERGERVEIGER